MNTIQFICPNCKKNVNIEARPYTKEIDITCSSCNQVFKASVPDQYVATDPSNKYVPMPAVVKWFLAVCLVILGYGLSRTQTSFVGIALSDIYWEHVIAGICYLGLAFGFLGRLGGDHKSYQLMSNSALIMAIVLLIFPADMNWMRGDVIEIDMSFYYYVELVLSIVMFFLLARYNTPPAQPVNTPAS